MFLGNGEQREKRKVKREKLLFAIFISLSSFFFSLSSLFIPHSSFLFVICGLPRDGQRVLAACFKN
jgi:hypothetical protein